MAFSMFNICVYSLICMSDFRTWQRAHPRHLAPHVSADLTQTTGYKQYHDYNADGCPPWRQ